MGGQTVERGSWGGGGEDGREGQLGWGGGADGREGQLGGGGGRR